MIKSPLNYIGGKYKLLPQILPLFPDNIDTFVDLFSGGLDVALNVQAEHIVCNDINCYVIELFEYFQQNKIEELIDGIYQVIDQYSLSKQNKSGFLSLRDDYNNSHSPLHLFLLICYGFNHQIRFNNQGEFNNPFGRNRSSYNANIEKNLRQMHTRLQNIEFRMENFKNFDTAFMRHNDFLYADPPYLITCGTYNDGKRGFEGWTEKDDMALFGQLDELNNRGIRFALSNVIRHKGAENVQLKEWASKYVIHYLEKSYANSNYQAHTTETLEVIVTNY